MICFLRTVAFVKAFLQIGQFFIGLLVFALEPPEPDFLSLVSLLFPSDLTLWLSLLRSDRSDVELPMKPDKVLFAGCVLFINLFCSIKLLKFEILLHLAFFSDLLSLPVGWSRRV